MTKKTPGIKKTNVPHMFRVNYPQHGQVGYVVRLQRLDKRFYEIFNFSQFPNQAVCRKAAENARRNWRRSIRSSPAANAPSAASRGRAPSASPACVAS